MNKEQKELLDKAINLGFREKLPLFRGIFIIQQRKLHDSGYRMMYVIGHTDYDQGIEDFKYYLLGTYSNVVDFEQPINRCDLHLDINKNGIIHIWTNGDKKMKCYAPYTSNCMFEIV